MVHGLTMPSSPIHRQCDACYHVLGVTGQKDGGSHQIDGPVEPLDEKPFQHKFLPCLIGKELLIDRGPCGCGGDGIHINIVRASFDGKDFCQLANTSLARGIG